MGKVHLTRRMLKIQTPSKKMSKVYPVTSVSATNFSCANCPQPITLFQQFYISTNAGRQKEIIECLNRNQNNKCITKICLLNERLYSLEELGLFSLDKIQQIVISKRLRFSHVFEAAQDNEQGWNVLANADIFFDDTLSNLYSIQTDRKLIFALLRWEYPSAKLFGPRADSQDSWIWHSSQTSTLKTKTVDFLLGVPGCDNRLAYEFQKDFQLLNVPHFIRTHHYHSSKVRNYSKEDSIPGPYCTITPFLE